MFSVDTRYASLNARQVNLLKESHVNYKEKTEWLILIKY
jgi:hypothetical protein